MSVLDTLISFVAPYECIGCGGEGSLLCPHCLTGLPMIPEHCYRCLRPTGSSLVCLDCPATALTCSGSATVYHGLAKDLLWGLKSGGMQAAVKPMAQSMLRFVPDNCILVPVPTATGRVRQRGYDQAVLLAHELARQTGLPCKKLLRRSGQAHQVGADRQKRRKQLTNAYLAKPATGLHILLIDDVMTTGATLEAAATVLLHAGAARVDGLTFARA